MSWRQAGRRESCENCSQGEPERNKSQTSSSKWLVSFCPARKFCFRQCWQMMVRHPWIWTVGREGLALRNRALRALSWRHSTSSQMKLTWKAIRHQLNHLAEPSPRKWTYSAVIVHKPQVSPAPTAKETQQCPNSNKPFLNVIELHQTHLLWMYILHSFKWQEKDENGKHLMEAEE